MTSAVPPHSVPGTDAALGVSAGARSRSTVGRTLGAALLLGAVGSAVVLLASRQGWASGKAIVPGGTFPLTVKGSDVTGVPAALAIVGLAALVAVFAVRRSGRLLVSALLALSGAGTIAAALIGAADRAGLDGKAEEVAGGGIAGISDLSHTAWPYVAALGGLLILLAGLLALRYGSGWPAMSGRYERDGTPRPRKAPTVDPDRPEDIWKALDRGEDPTG
ncbi:TIGR02234 family membrane protein [Streptomyces sp. NPDC091292]|uniref:TIGR02234 family membrane protein n=1 Tax=Streptomyces sp. NPDC091292 TaxID=3365991 RepID=UPI0037F87D55